MLRSNGGDTGAGRLLSDEDVAESEEYAERFRRRHDRPNGDGPGAAQAQPGPTPAERCPGCEIPLVQTGPGQPYCRNEGRCPVAAAGGWSS